MKKIFFLITLLILLAGCSTAGPFVTNISSDGRGGLNIEKQQVEYNWFLGVVSTKNPTTSNIQISNSSSGK
ncbi:MAG: lipoprotein [Candidatus Omnitrophota bacterium]|jgi:type IV secretion system protein VirB7